MPLFADPLRGELWIRADLLEILQPGQMIRETQTMSDRERAAIDELLEDARWAFSGMIYGFNVRWVPSARARSVDEILEIEPIALIPRGDPRMTALSIARENGFVYVLLEYRPDENQQRRIDGWRGNRNPTSNGSGLGSMFDEGPRRRAMEVAIKESLRSWLRAREFNRPREIRGSVGLVEFPETGLSAGNFRANVSVSMDLDSVNPYAID